jgi:hypothetical protein
MFFFTLMAFLYRRSDHDAQLSEESLMFLQEIYALPLNILATYSMYITIFLLK